MTRLGDLEVQVKIGVAYAPEYDDDDDEAGDSNSVTTRYIEAVAGANFAIECSVLPSYVFDSCSLSFQIFLDGQRAGGVHLSRTSHQRSNGAKSLETHAIQHKGLKDFLMKYKFADLGTREALPGEDAKQMLAKYKMLGTISVQVWRKERGGVHVPKQSNVSKMKTGEPDAVPEKALKGRALALATCLEPDGESEPSVHWTSLKLDSHPVATFNFKYRTRQALRSLLILPQSPAPVPLEERPVADLTPDELRELVLRQKAQLQSVKQEDEPKVGVKRERSLSLVAVMARPSKIGRTADGNLIYKLDSDEEMEPGGSSTSRTVSENQAAVEVIDLLD